MIKSLSLTNFRKHEKLVVEFTAGLNGIFGANYTGKSTITYGIRFALGGIRAIPCSTVVRDGATTFRVAMGFSAGDDYFVVRTKSTDRLYKGLQESDENLIANGATVVNKKIEEILGMSIKRFLQTRCAEQKKTHAILMSGANELYAVINEISGADTVEAGIVKLADRAKRLDGFLDNTTMPDIASIQENLAASRLALTEKSSELEMWQGMNEKNKIEKELSAAAVAALRVGERDFIRYASDVSHARRDLESAVTQMERIQSSAVPVDVTALTQQESDCRIQMEYVAEKIADQASLSMLIAAQRRDLTDVEIRLRTTQEAFSLLVSPKDPGINAEAIHKMREELGSLLSRISSTRQTLEVLQSDELEPNCSKCGRPWEDHAEKKAKLDAETAQLNTTLAELQPKAISLQEAISTQSGKLEDYQKKLGVFESSSASQQQLITGFQARLQQLQPTLASNEARLASICPDGIEALTASKAAFTDELTKIQRSLRRVDQDKQDYDRAEERRQQASTALQALLDNPVSGFSQVELDKAIHDERVHADAFAQSSTALATCKAQHEAMVEKVASLESVLPEVIERAEKYTAAEKSRSVIKSLTKFLKANRDRYMADVWTVLMAQASQFVQQCTSGAIEAVSRTDDGGFTYTEDSKTLPVSEASGAQLSIMGLAIQLALSSAVQPPLDVLLVDEPNADMDPEHSMAVNLLLAATVGQVICVSHSHMDSAVCENVIEL